MQMLTTNGKKNTQRMSTSFLREEGKDFDGAS
jgi:hypothetical protein